MWARRQLHDEGHTSATVGGFTLAALWPPHGQGWDWPGWEARQSSYPACFSSVVWGPPRADKGV